MHYPLIEFSGHPLLLAQQPCLLQPDGRLICRHAQKQLLRLPRKVRTPRSSCNYANFTVRPQTQRHDRNVFVSNPVPYQRRPLLWVVSQPLVEHLADLSWFERPSSRQFQSWSDPRHLDRHIDTWVVQPHIDEIQAEHTQERIEQSMGDLGWLAAAPHGRER